MVNGLELFLLRFQGLEDCFILIGGTACDLWMTDKGLSFRADLTADNLESRRLAVAPPVHP
jgi:hypothetical protein